MLALELPAMSKEKTGRFIAYFADIAKYLRKQDLDVFGDENIARALGYFSHNLTPKLIRFMDNNDLQSGINEVLAIIAEIVYVENMHDYVYDRYKIDLKHPMYSDAIVGSINSWHSEMLMLSRHKRSYEEGYRATLLVVKEYWEHQPHKGRA